MLLRLAMGLLLACAYAMPSSAQNTAAAAEDPIAAANAVDPTSPPIENPSHESEKRPVELPIFIVEEGAPPGFENLDLPEQTLIDLSYGGLPLSPAPAIYTSTSIRFLDPAAIASEIPGILFREEVVHALSGTLDPNAHLVCEEPGVPDGCGVLEPRDAGVIFDLEHFRAEIFVGRSMLPLSRINKDERIPPPKDEWSGLATLGGSVSGSTNSEVSYNFRGDTLIAKGATHLKFVSDLQTGGNYVVDRLSINHDWKDWQITGGLYRSASYRVLGENEVVGVRMRSSLRTRTRLYLDRAYGSSLQVFLLRRSLVQIFRDGRLLVGAVYDVGNQQLDTSELPSGAYEVEIRVRDPISGERRERHFFAKTNDLPPLGEIHFNAEAGFLRERADRENPLQVSPAGLLRFSSSMRTSKRFGLDLDVALIDEETIFTAGGLWLGQNLLIRSGPIVTSRGSAGVEFFGSIERGPFNANVNLRGFWGDTSSRFLRIPSLDLLYSAAYTWKRIRFAIRGNLRDRSLAGDPRYSITPSIQVPLFRRTRLRGDLRIEYTRADRGNIFFVKLDLVQWYKDFQFSQSAGGRYDDTRGDPEGIGDADLRARWRSPPRVPVDLQADLRVSRRRDRTSIAANGDLRSHLGAINAFVEQSFHDDEGPDTFYGTQFSVGIVGDRNGVNLLGENAGLSAVMIEIEGDQKKGLFDIFVNDSRRAKARVGQPLLLPLPPYGQYDVRISAVKGQSIDYDSTVRKITLYPGSTARLKWEIRRIFVLIAAVVRPDGSTIAGARVEGAVGEAETDENGFIQADVVPGGRLRIRTRDPESVCEIAVPENSATEDFMILEQIVCQSEPPHPPDETPAANTTSPPISIP